MKLKYFIPAILILLLISCNKENPDVPGEPADLNLKDGSEFVIESMNEFGLDIFRLLNEDEEDDVNIFISPTSISLALAMTLNGANTSTEDSMAFAMRMDHLPPDQINETYRDLMAGLKTCDEKVLLEIANSIWYREGYPVEQDFLDINEEYYNAEVRELDFFSPEAIGTINNWVADNTHDKITEIIKVIDPQTIMFLINAIYFKGVWAIEFDEDDTQNATFYNADNSASTVKMMHMEDTIGYYENELFQACELDYGRGNFSMLVFLPKYDVTIDEVISELNEDNWNTWLGSFYKTEVNLNIPRFKFEYEKELNDVLKLMGMEIAFDPWLADFSGINPTDQLYISYVKHKTFVEVNEEGTEAAAVTVVAVNLCSAMANYMIVDRPFLFAIREKTTNTTLFIGKVAGL
jgi:serpin B